MKSFGRRAGRLRRGVAASAVLVLGIAGTTLPVCAQEAVTVSPHIKSFRLGAFDISVLRDGAVSIPNNGSIFGLSATPAAVAEVLRKAGVATDSIRLDVDVLLVRMPGHIVLFDTGYGPGGHGILQKSLALTGVSAGDITDIFITHSHPDHVGGLVDGKGQLAFPNAAIRMSAAEWEFMQSHKADTEVAVIKPRVHPFTPGKPVLPGVTPIALYGHTPGHVGYSITSQGHSLMDTGDLAHSSVVSLAKPGWTIAWDSDKVQGVKIRQQELQRLAETHELMFAPHFPFPGVGVIETAGDGFQFKPGVPAGGS